MNRSPSTPYVALALIVIGAFLYRRRRTVPAAALVAPPPAQAAPAAVAFTPVSSIPLTEADLSRYTSEHLLRLGYLRAQQEAHDKLAATQATIARDQVHDLLLKPFTVAVGVPTPGNP